jgi:hypothetical protein
MSRAAFKASDVRRVLAWVQSSGLSVEAVEITVDGSLRVLTTRPQAGVAVNQNEDWVSHAGAKTDLGHS